MRKLLKNAPKGLKHLLAYCIMNLIVSIIYPYIKAAAYVSRGYDGVGGEFLLWIVPLLVLIAYDTYKKGKRTN